ncbi:hypothetical protein Rhopal_006425-T1, partial [Rhodotorula paludigena]
MLHAAVPSPAEEAVVPVTLYAPAPVATGRTFAVLGEVVNKVYAVQGGPLEFVPRPSTARADLVPHVHLHSDAGAAWIAKNLPAGTAGEPVFLLVPGCRPHPDDSRHLVSDGVPHVLLYDSETFGVSVLSPDRVEATPHAGATKAMMQVGVPG